MQNNSKSEIVKGRVDFAFFYDAQYSNPNGDPDAGNMPRMDPETGIGLVTDVCLKRKVRNYVEASMDGEAGYRIYIKGGKPLNTKDAEVFEALGIEAKADTLKKAKEEDPALDEKVRDWMCANFYDIRTFGAVMTTFVKNKLNCGQVTGPVQLGFSMSIEPVVPQEITITRVAITTEEDAEKKGNEMGRKYIVPYGLYKVYGHISARLAGKTGFTEDDMELFFRALKNMFEDDRSAARGDMAARDLIIFKHASKDGNAPAHQLFDLVKVERTGTSDRPARSYSDYRITVDKEALPDGVSLEIR